MTIKDLVPKLRIISDSDCTIDIGYNNAIIELLNSGLLDDESYLGPVAEMEKSLQKRKIDVLKFATKTVLPIYDLHGANPASLNEAINAVDDGMKLQAVKFFKDATGLGLKDAKDVIDYYATLVNVTKL